MSVKHNLEQWISGLDSDGMCDISDNQVIALIRGYAALEAKCAVLAAENAELKDYLAPIGLKIEGAPSTDAFLAEVRAQGVEMFAGGIGDYAKGKSQSTAEIIKATGRNALIYAAQLRQEAAK